MERVLDLDDPSKARWKIPAERFKSNAIHIVPLSADALAVIATVPRFNAATTCSRSPTA